MRTLLPLVAVCLLSVAPQPASAQIAAVPGEAVQAQPIVPPTPPLGQRMAPALKVRLVLPPRLPDGRRHPDESRLLNENEKITNYNIALLDAWLLQLADSEWTEADRAAAVTALKDLKKEYEALAEILRAQRDSSPYAGLPRLNFHRLQKPLLRVRGGETPEQRRELMGAARHNFLVTKANLVEAEVMPDSRQDVETARKYHEQAAATLSELEALEQEGRSGAGEGVRKARAALKDAAPGAPEPD